MSDRDNGGGAVGGILLGGLIALIFLGALFGVALYVEDRDRHNQYVWSRVDLEKDKNAALHSLINEIAQDNADLRALLGLPAAPPPAYPPSVDPSEEPHP